MGVKKNKKLDELNYTILFYHRIVYDFLYHSLIKSWIIVLFILI